jgi:chemotaxis protein CheD
MRRSKQAIDIFLQPGEFFVAQGSCRIRTLLGSCVAITLWHPGRCIGAMSHFLLATRGLRPVAGLDGRFGEDAMTLMLRELACLGVDPMQCEAKLFGGGNMFPRRGPPGSPTVGERNGECAHRVLRAHGIGVVSESLFGEGHRQIIFDVASGHVWVRQTKPVKIGDVGIKESA